MGWNSAAIRTGGGGAPAAVGADRAYNREARRGEALDVTERQGICAQPGRPDRQPGSAAGAGRVAGDLSERVAGGGGRKPGGAHVSRPEPLSFEQRANA